jgi:hypothetical protein
VSLAKTRHATRNDGGMTQRTYRFPRPKAFRAVEGKEEKQTGISCLFRVATIRRSTRCADLAFSRAAPYEQGPSGRDDRDRVGSSWIELDRVGSLRVRHNSHVQLHTQNHAARECKEFHMRTDMQAEERKPECKRALASSLRCIG